MAFADIDWSAKLAATSGNVSPSYGLCRDVNGDAYVVATTANLAIANGRISGIARTAGAPSGTVVLQYTGEINVTDAGLGPGAASFVELDATGRMVRSALVSALTVGTVGAAGDVLLAIGAAVASVGVTPAVVFDNAVAGTNTNIRGNRAQQGLGIDNTKTGIVDFSSDTGILPSLGVTGDYATCVGGDSPSITGMYAGGGGYRPNSRSMGAWAFGFSSFADGECCFAAGRSVVAGRIPTDPLGEAKYSICIGASSFATGEIAIALGGNNAATGDKSTCIGYNCAANDVGAFAGGNGSTANASQATAFGGGQNTGVGSLALGACTNSADYGMSTGYGSSASASYAVAQGLFCTATEIHSRAFGRYAVAIRIAQEAHSGGLFVNAGDAQWSRYSVHGIAVDVTPKVLTDLGGNNLTLENGKAYAVRATTILGRTVTAARAMHIHDLLVHCSANVAVIDNDNATLAVANGTAWTVVYSVSGASRDILCTVTGTIDMTIRALTTYEWSEIGGLT